MPKTIAELEKALNEASEEHRESREKLNKAYKRWEKAKEAELNKFTFSVDLFTPEFYKTYLSEFDRVTSQHKMIEKFYGSFDKRLKYGGSYHIGEWYPIPQVRISKGDTNFDDIITGLECINDMLEQKELMIDIFEHTLSEYGSYNMNWCPEDNHCEIIKTTYSSPSKLFEGSLLGCLTECGEKYYYE